jgi:hypothetical protein
MTALVFLTQTPGGILRALTQAFLRALTRAFLRALTRAIKTCTKTGIKICCIFCEKINTRLLHFFKLVSMLNIKEPIPVREFSRTSRPFTLFKEA